MEKIDIDKFVASMFTAGRFDYSTLLNVRECLSDQGLECVDGKIVEIRKQQAHLRIEKGKKYACIRDICIPGGPSDFDGIVILKGEICIASEDGIIKGTEFDYTADNYFRKATVEEIKASSLFRPGEWIVQMLPDGKKFVGRIEEICESWYEVTDVNGQRFSISFLQEKNCLPWNVRNDAVNGDILSCKGGTFVYNGTLLNGNACGYLGSNRGVFILGSVANEPSNYWWWKDVWPALREERERLLEEMKRHGYTMEDIVTEHSDAKSQDNAEFPDAQRKFEKAIQSMVNDTFLCGSNKMTDLGAKNWAEYLLILAKDVFRHETDIEIELAYRNSDEIVLKHGYEKGYAAALARYGIKEDECEEETR